jgi:hypothetical protein
VLGVAIPHRTFHHHRRNRAHPRDDLLRLVEPSHMRVAGSENAIGYWEARSPFERGEQVCRRLIEPAAEEMGFAYGRQIRRHTFTWAEAQIGPKVLKCEIGLTGKKPKQSAPVPTRA